MKTSLQWYLLLFTVSIFAVSFFPQLPIPSPAYLQPSLFDLFSTLSQQFLSLFWGTSFLFVSLIVVVVMAFIVAVSVSRQWLAVVSIVSGALVGMFLANSIMVNQLPLELEGIALNIEGVVEGLPHKTNQRQRFKFRIQSIDFIDDSKYLPEQLQKKYLQYMQGRLIQLSWYEPRHRSSGRAANKAVDTRPAANTTVQTGQQWRWVVKLRRPRGFVNPAGFDYQVHLLRQGIAATGYVRQKPKPQLLPSLLAGDTPDKFSYHCALSLTPITIDCLRAAIHQRLVDYQQHGDTLGPLLALMIGDTQSITIKQWAIFRNTGTVHLFAISGLHIGLAAAIGFLLGRVGTRGYLLLTGCDTPYYYLPPILSVVFAIIYGVLADMSLPTQRAIMMVVLFHLSALLRYRLPRTFVVLIALLLIACIDPLAVHSQGFWLSFLAVVILLYGFAGRPSLSLPAMVRYLVSLIRSQWLLTVGLLLASAVWLQGMSISAPIANTLAITLVSLLIVPLLFLLLALFLLPEAMIGDAFPRFTYVLAEEVMGFLLWCLQWIDESFPEFFYFPFSAPSWLAISLSVFSVVWLLAPRGVPHRYLGLLGFLPLFFPHEKSSPLTVTFLDAGQGTAVVIATPNKTLVYDVGKAFSPRFNVGEHIIAPYLRASHIQRVDMVMISHNDADHVGGLAGLLHSLPVDRVLSGQAIDLESEGVPSSLCRAGQQWVWDEVRFSIVWPRRHHHDKKSGHLEGNTSHHLHRGRNANSCVLLIEFEGHKVLLTGDVEKVEEQALIYHDLFEHHSQLKGIDLLLVPHHGSKTSSSLKWLSHLQPRWSVITAGYRNQYGHPHSTVLQRYQMLAENHRYAVADQAQSDHQPFSRFSLLNTANQGAIRFSLERSAGSSPSEAFPAKALVNTGEVKSSKSDHSSQYQWRLERWRKDYGRYWHD